MASYFGKSLSSAVVAVGAGARATTPGVRVAAAVTPRVGEALCCAGSTSAAVAVAVAVADTISSSTTRGTSLGSASGVGVSNTRNVLLAGAASLPPPLSANTKPIAVTPAALAAPSPRAIVRAVLATPRAYTATRGQVDQKKEEPEGSSLAND